ncbi:MAG: hypothetical protein ACXVQY_12735 [Actinomycetota bacterium]
MRLSRWRASAGVAGLAIFLVAFVAFPAWATHALDRFELDGNAVASAAPGEDWNQVVPVDHSSSDIVSSFVRDGSVVPADTSYFTGGGSKDLNDVTDWRHTTGDVAPDKNEITDAFAVAYVNTETLGANTPGDLLVYFGLDRYANNGDAQVGFWFFRNSVGMNPGSTFSGRHTVGDVLVLSHFTQGGRVSDVNVYKWVGSGGSDGALDLLLHGQDCVDAAATDAMCATINQNVTPAPWSYTPKFGSAGTFPTGSLYEGGINITRLVPGVECLKSFMAETRSSQSVTAQLKDLALGPFDTCPVFGETSTPGVALTSLAATGTRGEPQAVVLGMSLLLCGIALRLLERIRVRPASR